MQPTNSKEECYVLQVLTGQEQDVVSRLRIAGREACAPMEWCMERRLGCWTQKRRTVMPGYVFVFTELDVGTYYAITSLPGVIGILKRGNAPVPLTCDELIRCQWLLKQDILEPTVVQCRTDTSGKRSYTLIAGPLVGLYHEITQVKPRHRRVTVRIPMAGGSREVTLSAKFI